MLDTIELTLWQSPDRKRDPRRIQLVRTHILRWMPEHNDDGTIIKQVDGEQILVAQDYATVTHLLTCDEREDETPDEDPLAAAALAEINRAHESYARYLAGVTDPRD